MSQVNNGPSLFRPVQPPKLPTPKEEVVSGQIDNEIFTGSDDLLKRYGRLITLVQLNEQFAIPAQLARPGKIAQAKTYQPDLVYDAWEKRTETKMTRENFKMLAGATKALLNLFHPVVDDPIPAATIVFDQVQDMSPAEAIKAISQLPADAKVRVILPQQN